MKMKNNLALKKLHGIKPKGVKTKRSSALEKLFELESIFVNEVYFEPSESFCSFGKHIYNLFNSQISNDFEISPSDLETYVCSRNNIAEGSDESVKRAKAVGTFSGVLLSLLNYQTNEKGKKSRLEIEGGGNHFDYLFKNSRGIDELIISNFSGTSICQNLERSAFDSDFLLIDNCKTDKLEGYCDSSMFNQLDLLVLTNNYSLNQSPCVPVKVETIISVDNSNVVFNDHHRDFVNPVTCGNYIIKLMASDNVNNKVVFHNSMTDLHAKFSFKDKHVFGDWRYEHDSVENHNDLDTGYKRIFEGNNGSKYRSPFLAERKAAFKNNIWCPDECDIWSSRFVDNEKALKVYDEMFKDFKFGKLIDFTLSMSGKSTKEIEYYAKKIQELKNTLEEKYGCVN
jgi:hypothetical protein